MSQELPVLASSASSLLGFFVAAVILAATALFLYYRKQGSDSIKAADKNVKTDVLRESEPEPAAEEQTKPHVRLLYGTQTGTAERFSKQIAAELRQLYNDEVLVEVTDLEYYNAEKSFYKENLVLFLVATYGDGEPTDNAAEFFNWLVEEGQALTDGEKEPYLSHINYGVFALGNKQYEHFCAVGKKIDKIMKQLGADRMVRRGDGDDDDCIDDDFDSWKQELLSELQKRPEILGQRVDKAQESHQVASYNVEVMPSITSAALPYSVSGAGTDHHAPFVAVVTRVQELHSPGSDRCCVHAEIDISGSEIKYKAGDHLALLPENSQATVKQAAHMLGHELETVIRVSVPDPNPFDLSELFDTPVSLATALTCFTDLLSSPRKEALLALAAYASDPDEKMRLEHLASTGGKQEYTEWITHAQRSLLEVMAAFPSAKPPLGVFFACAAPRLQARFYSISSSPKEYPTSVHVTCAVVHETVPSGRIHEGVCSTWLQKLPVGSKIPVFWRHSQFKLPSDWSMPVVMVGPGTGLAPFRGFMQERRVAASQGETLGEAILFFGCRNRQHDYIYQEELQEFLQAGAITELHVAFSREHAHKDYVQHHMEQNAETVWKALSSGGYLYVCGDAKHMAKDVHRTLINLVAKCQGRGTAQAEKFVQELTESGRYHRDVW